MGSRVPRKVDLKSLKNLRKKHFDRIEDIEANKLKRQEAEALKEKERLKMIAEGIEPPKKEDKENKKNVEKPDPETEELERHFKRIKNRSRYFEPFSICKYCFKEGK